MKNRKNLRKNWRQKYDKQKFAGGGENLQNSSLNPCKIKKTDRINNIIFKDVKEFNIILLILTALLLIGISGTSSYALFSSETNSNNVISGKVVKSSAVVPQDNSGANVPVLTNNMIPVYYDESDNNWKKADITKKDATNPWYNYDGKKWANAVTVNDYQTSLSVTGNYSAEERIADIYGSNAMIYNNEPIINEKGEATFSGTGTEMGTPYGPSTTFEELCTDYSGNAYIDYLDSSRPYAKVQCDDAYNATIFEYNIRTGARDTYQKASAGTTIPMDDINAMFVWIPRYKYTYFSNATPVEIPITFEKGTSSTGTISCTDAIVASSDKSEVCTDTTNGSIIKGTSTYTHPAFTFGDNELTGIWVGKFETSGDDASVVKPDVIPTQKMDVSTFFKHSRNMELANNIYGFSQSGTTLNSITGEISGDSNNLDTHLIKNMEWGGITYFSHSKYGTCENGACTEVGKNNYHGTDLLTGCGAAAGSDVSDVCNKYNTEEGKKASTTGNIYGIYDMSGGAWEHVMANMQDESNKFYPKSSGTWSTTDVPIDKYYDKYSYDESGNYNEFSYGKLGDATKETQPTGVYDNWYNDYAFFLSSGYPWFFRGGVYGYFDAGLFDFYYDNGIARGDGGSRVVLSVSP